MSPVTSAEKVDCPAAACSIASTIEPTEPSLSKYPTAPASSISRTVARS